MLPSKSAKLSYGFWNDMTSNKRVDKRVKRAKTAVTRADKFQQTCQPETFSNLDLVSEFKPYCNK